MMRLAMA